MSEEIIVFEDVWKIYSPSTPLEVEALKGINFTLSKGEFVWLCGESGSGKTTFLNIAGLLDFCTKGKVFFKGKDVSKMSDAEISRIRCLSVGFVFQQPSFLPEFTAFENVLIPLYLADKQNPQEKANALFDVFNIAERKNHFPSQMSGGELQRLTVLRAIANNPSVILADEPTGRLDEENARVVIDAIKKAHDLYGVAVVFVTHNRELTKGQKKVINLKNGRIEWA